MVFVAVLIAASFFFLGLHFGFQRTMPRTENENLGPAELSWVIEGISERIGKLFEDLTYAQELQRALLSESSG